jgi:multidrug efflux pump subunit AcrA (membrane-fusion protein)
MRAGTLLFLLAAIILLLLTVATGYGVYLNVTKTPEAEETKISAIPVHVLEVGTGEVEDVVYVTGYVEAADRVDCYAKIPYPGKLISARVKKGDQVSRDQVLLTVDRDEVGAVYLAYAVKAPAAGVIAHIQDEPGSLVSAQQAVATILKLDEVIIQTTLIERDLGRVQEGKEARIKFDAYPDRVFTGTVTRINPVLDEFSHTAPIEITVSNSDRALKPGMFAQIELVMHKKSDAVVVPREVVLRREGETQVYLVAGDTAAPPALRIFLTTIELGYYDMDQYEITAGVEVGDLVADQDLVVLKDRTKVSVLNPPEGWEDPTKSSKSSPDKVPPGADSPTAPSEQPGHTTAHP